MAPAVVVVVVVVVVVGATNNADGWQKKNSPDAPGVPDQTCTYRFLAGRCSQKRAGRKRGHPPPLVVSAADTRAGDGWRRFFSQCTPRPDLHTPIGWRGARKKGGRRRSTQGNGRQPRVIWRRRRSPPEKRALHRVTTLAGGQAGGRAAAKPINDNPAAGKLTSSCCVLPYCRHLL